MAYVMLWKYSGLQILFSFDLTGFVLNENVVLIWLVMNQTAVMRKIARPNLTDRLMQEIHTGWYDL